MWQQICKENTFGIFWNKCQVSTIGNDEWWVLTSRESSEREVDVLSAYWLQLRDTGPSWPWWTPSSTSETGAVGCFGCGLAKAWLGHQEAWIIVGSANHMGPTAFMEESWHLMVMEKMRMKIYKYIYFWSRVTVVLGTAWPEHIQTKPQTANF